MKRTLLLIAIGFILTGYVSAQKKTSTNQRTVDSLNNVFSKSKSDSIKMELCLSIAGYQPRIDSLNFYLQKASKISQSFNYPNAKIRMRAILQSRLNVATVDSDKVNLYYSIAETALNNDTTFYIETLKNGLALAHKKQLYRLEAVGLNSLGNGVAAYGPSNFKQQIALYDSALKISMRIGDKSSVAQSYHVLGVTYRDAGDYSMALEYYNKGNAMAIEANDSAQLMLNYHDLGWMRITMKNYEGSYDYLKKARSIAIATKDSFWIGDMSFHLGEAYCSAQQFDSSLYYNHLALNLFRALKDSFHISSSYLQISRVYKATKQWNEADSVLAKALTNANDSSVIAQCLALMGDVKFGKSKYDEALAYYLKAEKIFKNAKRNFSFNRKAVKDLYEGMANTYSKLSDYKNAYYAHQQFKNASDSLSVSENAVELNAKQSQLEFEKTNKEQERKTSLALNELKTQKLIRNGLIGGFSVVVLFAGIFFRQRNKTRKEKLRAENALTDLKSTQDQLVQSEKLASLGALTAGIAHEIKNPLNFVNNFSELSNELVDEFIEATDETERNEIAKDLKTNLQKINEHGKRADSIVKNMLAHSRTGSGEKQLTNINQICDEYLNLAYHGMRANNQSFNCKMEKQLDKNLPLINCVPQDISRVILNLINNAFDELNECEKSMVKGEKEYQPKVQIITKLSNNQIIISIKDNGRGIPSYIKEKIFEPFFTTKPAGQGTGLGLSLSYDIIKAHGGKIEVDSKENEYTEFVISLPM